MRLVMMGTGTFAEPTFEAILGSGHQVVGLVTQPDRAVGEKRGSTRQIGKGMKEIALERGVPVFQPESINTPEGVARLKTWQPDLLVVAAYGQILSKDVLAVAAHGGINVHASLLPKYRGAAPIAWAIYHGEQETGVTIIRMSIHLDAGDMLARAAVAIGSEETTGELEARLGPLGASLAIDVVNRIAAGVPLEGLKQDKSQATKAPKLTKAHGLVDSSRPAEAVCQHIRAMQPWPTAYTFLHRDGHEPLRLIVCKAMPFPARHDATDATGTRGPTGTPAPAGTVFTDAGFPGRLFVSVGVSQPPEAPSLTRNVVELRELQPAGKKRMSAEDFLRGNALGPAARLGPHT